MSICLNLSQNVSIIISKPCHLRSDGTYAIIAGVYRVVLDTNILVSALRSREGASNRLFAQLGSGRFQHVYSNPLIHEYEDVLLRPEMLPHLSSAALNEILDFVCQTGEFRPIYFLVRPFLKDPKDEHLLELAVNGQCSHIVTYNLRDFRGSDQYGVEVIKPHSFLDLLNQS